jgi:hypothetical protein
MYLFTCFWKKSVPFSPSFLSSWLWLAGRVGRVLGNCYTAREICLQCVRLHCKLYHFQGAVQECTEKQTSTSPLSHFLQIWRRQLNSIYLSVCLSTYLPIYLPAYIYINQSICLSAYLPIYISVYQSIYLSTYRSVCLPTYLSIYISTYLFVHIYIYLLIYLLTYVLRNYLPN